ncbi:MAG: hypothetical protein KTR21_17340 [Rhodobacteraceae bacterium]|nr:hypothetical protein [Paracoccaceae bacterium]
MAWKAFILLACAGAVFMFWRQARLAAAARLKPGKAEELEQCGKCGAYRRPQGLCDCERTPTP